MDDYVETAFGFESHNLPKDSRWRARDGCDPLSPLSTAKQNGREGEEEDENKKNRSVYLSLTGIYNIITRTADVYYQCRCDGGVARR